ncbi:hypothetical protein TanjilG_10832 [Lupinus angustifolius]|uniref:Uncharacterized protein n=1 Tax=Lupinus angustifolius TaxID=3871 RepID=A0A1J7GM92_LUPAN|nr:hypothetical protein TanjilG_10832 [Lupinus angustifolius]
MTRSQKSDLGQEVVQAKQASGQTKFLTELTRSRAIWPRQMHQDVGQEYQGASGPDLIKVLSAWNQTLGVGPSLNETGRTRLGVAHRPTGRGQALSQALASLA